jgi:capsid assembly protease
MRAAARRGDFAKPPDSTAARSRYGRILQVVAETPWAMLPQSLAMLMRVLEAHASGDRVPEQDVREAFHSSERDDRQAAGGVAVVPIYGPIFPRANLMTDMSGATDLADARAAFRAALAADEDSPGGVVSGIPEFADEVRAASGEKPIVAIANASAFSAAYWIGSAADELVVTPSGEVGSIGVWTAHTDWSRFDEMKGVKTTLISAGKFKVEGNPYEPLSEEAHAAIQADVDGYHEMFIAAVAKGRGVKPSEVRAGYGEGRTVVAKAALEQGMVDRIETFDQVVARLSRTPARRSRPTSVLDLPEEAFATREAVRAAFGLAASAERDPTGRKTGDRGAQAGTDPAAEGDRDARAPAETDPADGGTDGLSALKARTQGARQRAREAGIRLTKEMLE